MLVVAFMLLGISVKFGVTVGSHIFIYLAMLGLFLGSMLSVLLNIMSWVFPVTIVIVLVVYIWRTRS